jgi:hypothetical protein
MDLWFMGQYYAEGRVPFYYAPWFWFVSTPVIVLVCWGIGVGKIFVSRSEASPALLLWLILWGTAVFKHMVGSGNYDGVRHFLEAYAPMSLLAAYGALALIERIKTLSLWRKRWTYAFVGLSLFFPLYTGWRIHPYQSGYFNIFAGPLPDAWQQYEVEYWGQSFLRGSTWIKQHIDPSVSLYVPEAAHIAKHYLAPPFKVNTMKPYWEFSELSEFKSAVTSFLKTAPPEAILMKLNRPRLYRDEMSFGCPAEWKMIHKEGPGPDLPPMMLICRKSQTV